MPPSTDTVDHGILLQSLQIILGVSFLVQIVLGREIVKNLHKGDLKWGFPQGSCVRPLLFTIYTQDLFSKC